MISYQFPHRTVEAAFCRQQPTPEECLEYYLNPSVPNIPASSLEVKKSEVGEGAGRGLFTKVDIPEGAYVAAETGVNLVKFLPSTISLILELWEARETPIAKLELLLYYMDGYGFTSRNFVSFAVCHCKRMITSSET